MRLNFGSIAQTDIRYGNPFPPQAAARIHRLGQYKPVKVVNIIAAGTVEERILKLQEKKAAIFDATVGKENDAMGRLTPEDLKFLFQ